MLQILQRLYQTMMVVVFFFRPQRAAAAPEQHDEPIIRADETPLETVPDAQNPESEISLWQATKILSSFIFAKENIPRLLAAGAITVIGTGTNFAIPSVFEDATDIMLNGDETVNIAGYELSQPAVIALLIATYTLSQITPNLRYQTLAPVTANCTGKLLIASTSRGLRQAQEDPESQDELYIQKGVSASSVISPLLTQIVPVIIETAIACTVLSMQYGLMFGMGVLGLLLSLSTYSALTAKSVIRKQNAMQEIRHDALENIKYEMIQFRSRQDNDRYQDTMQRIEAELSRMAKADITGFNRPLQIIFGYFVIARTAMLLATIYLGEEVDAGQYSVLGFVILTIYLNILSNLLPPYGLAINQLYAAWPDLKFVLADLANSNDSAIKRPEAPSSLVLDEDPAMASRGNPASSTGRMLSSLGDRVCQPDSDSIELTAFSDEDNTDLCDVINIKDDYEQGHTVIDHTQHNAAPG